MIIAILVLIKACIACENASPWKQDGMPKRDDLFCPNSCKRETHDTYDTYDDCCRCYSCTSWEFNKTNLYIEYISVLGKTLVLAEEPFQESIMYEIIHRNSEMTEIPSNLCQWDDEFWTNTLTGNGNQEIQQFQRNIVEIDFTNNKIRKIVNLNCLYRLDTLNLANNKLQHLSNTSIANLTYLRHLDLSGNYITTMDPSILMSPFLSLLKVDLSHNVMEKLDVTNMLSSRPFCIIDYTGNHIKELVNEPVFRLDHNKTYGPGYVSLEKNIFETFPDFQELLDLDELSQLGVLMACGFSFLNIQLNCDCNLQPFISLSKDILQSIWRDYMNVTCVSPTEMAGIPIVKIPLEKLVCQIINDCPISCTCVEIPEKNTLYVDCSNANLHELPASLPNPKHSKYISLDISRNDIQHISNKLYLNQLSTLDISNNNLKEIDDRLSEFIQNITFINISNNPLHYFPKHFQYRNVCSLATESLLIDCNCDNIWIESWLKRKNCHGNMTLFKCRVENIGTIPGDDFQADMVQCKQRDLFLEKLLVIVASIILALIICAIVTYMYRYEILITMLRMRPNTSNSVIPLIQYDVFLSFIDEDDLLRKWVMEFLEPNLERKGYRTFIPLRDLDFGGERDTLTIDILDKTKNFLLVLSESYLEYKNEESGRAWTENEWKYGWNKFKHDKNKKIVVINYDHVSSFDVSHLQIKAYLRVGVTVDFANREGKIMEEIYNKLGPPQGTFKIHHKYMDNSNPIFELEKMSFYSEDQYDALTSITLDSNEIDIQTINSISTQ